MIRPFTTPEIKKYSNNDWCVEYWYQYPASDPRHPELKRFKVRDGINYVKDPVKKELEITVLQNDVKLALEEFGYNPFQHELREQHEAEELRIHAKKAKSDYL